MNLETLRAMPVARHLAALENVERATGLAIELATLLERLEDTSTNVSSKVALAHAGNFVLDAIACLHKAADIARRDGR